MCKHAVKEFAFKIRYILDSYRTQEGSGKTLLENGGTLKSVCDCYKNQRKCSKAVDNYTHALKFDPDCYKTREMCIKAVDTCPCTFNSVPD